MKKIFIGLLNLILITSAFAERNPLINVDDNDISGKGIIDIGSKDTYIDGAPSYLKEIIRTPALSRNIDREIIPIPRIHNEYDCLIDEYGHEACNTELETCNAESLYNSGNATKHNATITTPKIKTGESIYYPTNAGAPIYGIANIWPSFLKTYGVKNGNYSFNFYAPEDGTYKLTFEADNYGTATVDNLSDLSTNNWGTILTKNYTLTKGLHKININSGGDHATDAVAATMTYNGSIIWNTKTGENLNTVSYTCPTGYYDPINNSSVDGFCQKDYIYYTYTCPTDIDQWGNSWEGPLLNSGGDCRGLGVPEATGGTCPNAGSIPPAENCLRYNYTCPASNNTTECIAGPNNNKVGENIFDGYIYSIADTITHKNTLIESLTCPPAENQGLTCEIGWTLTDEYCQQIVSPDLVIPPVSGSCDSGYTLLNNLCYPEKDGLTLMDLSGTVYYTKPATVGLDPALSGTCSAKEETVCLSPVYTLDTTTNQCLTEPSCTTKVNDVCYEKPERKCEPGFSYDENNKDCRRNKECLLGDINYEVDNTGTVIETCRYEVDKCPTTGFELDRDIVGMCSTDLTWDNAYCGNTVATSASCFETVNYASWTKNYLLNTSNNTDWRIIQDQGGPAMYQSVNTNGVYLYPDKIDEFILQGKVRVGTGCGGGDDDTIGFVFGYKNSKNFWAVGWSRNINNGGTTLGGGPNVGLVLVKYVNGTRYALKSLADSYGWSCTTTYTDFKIINNAEGVQVYKNGNLVIDYKGGHAPKGKAGYFMNSQGEGYYKDFTILKSPTCKNPNMVYNELHNYCYLPLDGSSYTYDFLNKIILESPACTSGTYDSVTRECVEEPYCKLGGTEVLNEAGIKICKKDAFFECSSSDMNYVTDPAIRDLFNTDTDYIVGACKVNNPCGTGDTLVYVDGQELCATSDLTTKCPDGYTPLEINGVVQCLAQPTCKPGWTMINGSCKLDYTWNEYFCDTSAGWEESNDIYKEMKDICEDSYNSGLPECQELYTAGGDCHGSCGYDGCSCNSDIAPANSCRKPTSLDSNTATYSILKKRPLIVHEITGENLTPEEMNVEPRNVQCSSNIDNCQFTLNKVTGEGDSLCFEKKNGEKQCYKVDGCSFFGSIEPTEENPEQTITGLKLIDPYTMINLTNFEVPKINYSTSREAHGTLTCKVDKHFGHWVYNSPQSGNFWCRDWDMSTSGERRWDVKMTYDCNSDEILEGSTCKKLKYICPPNYFDPLNDETVNGVCWKNIDQVQSISSTCKMNGQVGWTGRNNPIVSIGNSPLLTNVTPFTVTGTGDFKDGTKWDNFNAATMAVQFSDGNWYTIANVQGTNLGEIPRDLPTFIKLLPNNYYSISNDTENNNCMYKNNPLDPGLCGNKVTIKAPKEKLYVTQILDIESLYGLYGGNHLSNVSDNQLSLTFIFDLNSDEKTLMGNGALQPINVLESATTVNLDNDYITEKNNRLRFWDSYIDGDIGFIEFVNTVRPADRLEGFVPEFLDYEEVEAKGFTSIRMLDLKDKFLDTTDLLNLGKTYFIRPRYTSETDCANYASDFGMTVVNEADFNVVELANLYKSMGIKEPGACILSKPGILIPSVAKWAVKSELYSGNVEYVCSPYSCVDHSCAVEECADNTNGTAFPLGYEPNPTDSCTDDKCDGNLDYVPFCGRLGSCPTNTVSIDPNAASYSIENIIETVTIPFNNTIGDTYGDMQANQYCTDNKLNCESHSISGSNLIINYISGTETVYNEATTDELCIELYCEEGVLDPKTKKCLIEKCPSGLVPDGEKCVLP